MNLHSTIIGKFVKSSIEEAIQLPFKIDNSIIYGNELDRDLDFMLYFYYIVELGIFITPILNVSY